MMVHLGLIFPITYKGSIPEVGKETRSSSFHPEMDLMRRMKMLVIVRSSPFKLASRPAQDTICASPGQSFETISPPLHSVTAQAWTQEGPETSVFRAKRHSRRQQDVATQAIVGDVQATETEYISVVGRDDRLVASDTVRMVTLQARIQRNPEGNSSRVGLPSTKLHIDVENARVTGKKRNHNSSIQPSKDSPKEYRQMALRFWCLQSEYD